MSIYILFALIFLVFLPTRTFAVCPICTITVSACVGLSRWLGVDDTISGVWIGGLILSSSLWLVSLLEKKKIPLPYKKMVSILLFYALVILPLYLFQMLGLGFNTLFGIDKLLLGIIVGSLLFLSGVGLDKYLRHLNHGEVFIYYQKVILPVVLILIGSIIFYLITC